MTPLVFRNDLANMINPIINKHIENNLECMLISAIKALDVAATIAIQEGSNSAYNRIKEYAFELKKFSTDEPRF
jgi:hypothetical protein